MWRIIFPFDYLGIPDGVRQPFISLFCSCKHREVTQIYPRASCGVGTLKMRRSGFTFPHQATVCNSGNDHQSELIQGEISHLRKHMVFLSMAVQPALMFSLLISVQ